MARSLDVRSFKKELKQSLGIRSGLLLLYRQAFRHRSALEEGDERFSNERLEFLGDSILDAIISEQLYHHYPEADEGFLTQMRSKLVSRDRLNELAEDLGVFRLLEHDLQKEGKRASSIGGDALEALVGAVYLDKGYKRTRKWVLRTLVGPLDLERLEKMETDPKSRIIEWAQKEDRKAYFEALDPTQEVHRVILYIDGVEVARGEGRTKKKGEQEAAQRFLDGVEEERASAGLS